MPNIYETRTMLKALEQTAPAYSFLKDTFFPNVETVPTETIEFDFKKGKREMGAFVSPRVGGTVLKRQGFKTKQYKVPKIGVQRLTTIDNITSRSLGENVYSSKTPAEREVDLLVRDLDELDQSILRREEWLCREVLLNGKLIMKGDGVEQEVDFGFDNKKVLSGTSLWSASDTAKPIDDLKEMRRNIIQKTGKAPTMVVLGSKAADAFISSKQVKDLMDKRHIRIGEIDPTVQNPAITFLGKISMLGLEVYSYDEWFIDDEDNEQPMIPEGVAILASPDSNKLIYGSVSQIEKGGFVTYEATRVPKVWVDEGNDVKSIRLSSRPLPVPEDVDGWGILEVI